MAHYSPLGYPRSCRFCGLGFPMTTEVLVAVPVGDRSLLARRRAAQRPYYEHPSCAADEEQAHAAGELVRKALYDASREAARDGRVDDAVALAEAAVEVLDSHYRQRSAA